MEYLISLRRHEKMTKSLLTSYTAKELKVLAEYTRLGEKQSFAVRFWSQFGADYEPNAGDRAFIMEHADNLQSGKVLSVGQIEPIVFAKKGDLSWIRNDGVLVMTCEMGGEKITYKYAMVPIPTGVRVLPGFARVLAFVCSFFHVNKGKLELIMNRDALKKANFTCLLYPGLLQVYQLVVGILMDAGIVGSAAHTLKGNQFYDKMTQIFLSMMETPAKKRDFIALQNVLIRKCIRLEGVTIREDVIESTRKPFIALDIEAKSLITEIDISSMKAHGMWPPVYLSDNIIGRFSSVRNDSTLVNAVASMQEGFSLRGSPEAGVTGLYAGAGFSGLPPRQIREALTVIGLARELGTLVRVFDAPIGIIPFLAQALGDSTTYEVDAAGIVKIPVEYRHYARYNGNKHGGLEGAKRALGVETPPHNANETNDIIFLGDRYVFSDVKFAENFKSVVTMYQGTKAVLVGRQIPFSYGRKSFVYSYREPYDFYCIDSPKPLVMFGDLKLVQYDTQEKFFEAVTTANRRVSAFWMAPVNHYNVKLSNWLKRPNCRMTSKMGDEIEWATEDFEMAREYDRKTVYNSPLLMTGPLYPGGSISTPYPSVTTSTLTADLSLSTLPPENQDPDFSLDQMPGGAEKFD